MSVRRPLLAVLIDADNISWKLAENTFKEIDTLGEAAVRRCYGDFSESKLKKWHKILPGLGATAHQVSATSSGKNASDIALVIDAMDLLHTGRFDGFVLVSSDSDFTRLASRIRELGVAVYGIGEEKTLDAFRNACSRFIVVEKHGNGDENPEVKSAQQTKPPSKAVPLVRRAMRSIKPNGEWYNLVPLGAYIKKENPRFDPRTYGCSKLSDLLRETGKFKVEITNNQAIMRANP